MRYLFYTLCFLLLTACTTPKPSIAPQDSNTGDQSTAQQAVIKKAPPIKRKAKEIFIDAGRLANSSTANYTKAIDMYERAYQEDQNLKMALYNIAFLYNQMKNKAKAIEYYKKAAEAGLGDGWVDIGLMQLDAKNQSAAENSFRRALSIEPLNGRAHLNLAIISKNRKAYDQAVDSVRNALKEDGSNADAYDILAQVYYDLGRYKLALLVANAGLEELDPENSSLWTTQGLIYLKLDDLIKAIKSFNNAIKYDRTNFAARLNLGLITFNYRDYEKSYNLFNEAVKLQPNHIIANLSKAVAARTLNRIDEARKGYEKVLALSPNHPAALFNLAVLDQDYVEVEGFDARTAHTQKAIKQYEMTLNYARDKKLRGKIAQRIEEARITLEAIAAEKEMAASEAAEKAAMEKEKAKTKAK